MQPHGLPSGAAGAAWSQKMASDLLPPRRQACLLSPRDTSGAAPQRGLAWPKAVRVVKGGGGEEKIIKIKLMAAFVTESFWCEMSFT